jgi:hypothetical protein
MKRIFLGLMAITLVTGVGFASDGGKKKGGKKAKVECTKDCREKKDCHKNALCPSKPGCVCS